MIKPTPCFHCGKMLDDPTVFATVDAQEQPVCCRGCKRAVELVDDSGAASFYQLRDKVAASAPSQDGGGDAWRTFDDDASRQLFVASVEPDCDEATLAIEGMYCSACGWLIEKTLGNLPGVTEVLVNATSSRVTVRWQPDELDFSTILATVACLGYRPHPQDAAEDVPVDFIERRGALKRLLIAGVGMMQVMMFAVALYTGAFKGIDADLRQFLRWVSLIVATPVVVYAGKPFFLAAWRGLRRLQPGMDLPVAIAVGSAFLASVWVTVTRGSDVYFDSAVMFVFFLTVGRHLEMSARHRATAQRTALGRLLPDIVTVLADDEPHTVPRIKLAVGDRVLVRPGEQVPADGTLLAGRGSLDESFLTGEAQPLAKATGDMVVAGSINLDGVLTIEVARTGQRTTLAAVTRLLDRARAERPPLARLADRAAAWFVSAVLLVAAVVAIVWSQLDATRAFEVTLAVLVVTCPCALSLAMPTALAAAVTQLAERGVLITPGGALEALASAQHVLFDKTGTLTLGAPRIARTTALTDDPAFDTDVCLRIACTLEAGSGHVLARAFEDGAHVPPADAHVVPGRGIEGSVDGRRYRLGSAEFVARVGFASPPVHAASSAVYLADEARVLALFELTDQIKCDAAETVGRLEALGLKPMIASGDRPAAVAAVADALAIEDGRGALSPSDKLAWLQEIQSRGEKVVLVGDGINDTPVLAAADFSFALASGPELAQSSAGAILTGQRIAPLVPAVETARRTMRIVRQNLTWAVGYNLVALPLAVSGQLTPWLAALGMSGSSLIVVLNALRLRRGTETPSPIAPRPRPHPRTA